MKLLTSSASPYSRKVKTVLYETGLIDQVEMVNVKTSPIAVAPELRAANPLGKIPCLIRDDAPALYDSRVICRFLDAQAGGALYPEDQIWDVLTLEATAEGLLDSALSMVYETRFRPESMQSQSWRDSQWAKVDGALDALNETWISHLNARADAPDMGQLAVGCALGYLDFRLDACNWRSDYGALARWYGNFKTRESMQKTEPFDAV